MSTTATINTNLLASGKLNTAAASYATTNMVTPTAGRTIEAWVVSIFGGDPAIPTASGSGQTWVQKDTVGDGASIRATRFEVALVASPSAGQVTFAFGGATQLAAAWFVVEGPNANTTTPSVQSKTASASGSSTSFGVTLDAALTGQWNRVYGLVAVAVSGYSFDPQANCVLVNQQTASPAPGISVALVESGIVSPGVTYGSGSVTCLAMAVEIANANTGAAGGGGAKKINAGLGAY